MPKGTTDNTAVNRLIDLAQQRPVETDDSLFEQPRAKTALPPPFRQRGELSTAMPPPLPRNRAPAATLTDMRAAATPAPVVAPVAPPVAAPQVAAALSEHDVPTRPFDTVEPDAVADDSGLRPMPVAAAPIDRTPSVEAKFWTDADDGIDVSLDEPAPVVARATRRYAPRAQRHESTQITGAPRASARSWLWIGGAFLLGVTATAIIAWPRGNAVTPTAAPVAAAPAAPIVVPAPAPIVVPAPAPVVAAPAPVVVAEPVAVAVAEPVAVAVPVAETETVAETVTEPVAVAEPAPAPRAARPVRPHHTAAPAPAHAAPHRVAASPPAAPTGATVLMLGSKPPCEISIDGKRTGLTTPQRAIKVAPGNHRVTLVNKQYGINESFAFTATAGKPTKVVKDLTSKMRR